MPSKLFDEIDNSLPNYLEIFAHKSLDIIEQVHAVLEKRGLTQRDLATRLQKSESEISKWLSGGHNITLRTIAKIEDALQEDIILTPQKAVERFELFNYEETLKLSDILEADGLKLVPLQEDKKNNGCTYVETNISRYKLLVP